MTARVLLVDDEPHVTQVLKTFMKAAGFDVVTANNGEQGLERLHDESVDVIVTDFEMPVMNGRELIENIMADKGVRPQLIILASSRVDQNLRDWYSNNNDIEYVEKPISPRRLVRFIDSRLLEDDAQGTK